MASRACVTGIGGIFFKAQNPDELNSWYYEHLGLAPNDYGSLFEFRSADDPDELCYLQWSPFPADTEYFDPAKKEFMINYRVKDLEQLLENLRAAGITVVGEMETYEYGKFAHIMDPEGNKIELWEPVDKNLTEPSTGDTTH